MTTEEAWKLMDAYHAGIPWSAKHVAAVRVLIDRDLGHLMRATSSKAKKWAGIRHLIEGMIRTRAFSECHPD